MDSYITLIDSGKERQSLSCNDLAAIQSGYNDKQLRKHAKDRSSLARPRFLRSKSRDHSLETSMDRSKSKSSDELVDAVDSQLAEIRGKLAMLRRQDRDFLERMDSLTNSIGELTSQSSLPPSETSEGRLSDTDEDNAINGNDKTCTKDDWIIRSNVKSIPTSFSSEVLNSIPAIREISGSSNISLRRSEPSLHRESAKLLNLSTGSNQHSTCLADYYMAVKRK